MDMTQVGLIADMVGVGIVSFDSWMRFKFVDADSLSVGHGLVGSGWKLFSPVGYTLMLAGFVLQYCGAA